MTEQPKGKLVVHNTKMQDYDEIEVVNDETKEVLQRYVRVR